LHFVGLFLSSLLKMHGPKNKISEQFIELSIWVWSERQRIHTWFWWVYLMKYGHLMGINRSQK